MKRDEALQLLPEYALGVLSDAHRAAVAEWLTDPEVQAELRSIEEGLADFASAWPAVAPSDDARARLLQAADGPDRYSAVFEDIAKFCDLSLDAVRGVLKSIDDFAAWEPGPMPGIQIQHFDHGPASAGADTGFVRYPAHMKFPRHRHVGREITIVLDGDFVDHDGLRYGPGDVIAYDDGTEHHFEVGPQGLTIVICFGGYEPL